MTAFRSPAGALTRAILASLVLATTAARLDGQDTTVSATMLRVLAEGADVYRTGKPVFLVADYRYPHNVLRAFNSRSDALKAKADSGGNYGVFGPYVAPRDPIAETAPKIVAVKVTMQTQAGQKTYDVDPRQSDALFFSMSAVDKFVLPYYLKLLGPDYALRLRHKAIVAFRSGKFIRHCWSWGCVDPGEGPMRIIDPKADPRQLR